MRLKLIPVNPVRFQGPGETDGIHLSFSCRAGQPDDETRIKPYPMSLDHPGGPDDIFHFFTLIDHIENTLIPRFDPDAEVIDVDLLDGIEHLVVNPICSQIIDVQGQSDADLPVPLKKSFEPR
jgi:hypothetical protein